jgi:hypothetical protein
MGWEKAWRDTMGNDRFGSLVRLSIFGKQAFANGCRPSFLTASVEKGNRIITSNLRLTKSFLDADDAAEKVASHNLGATEATRHIPLSTAAHMSAHSTFVSAAERFPDGSNIVDGGYFRKFRRHDRRRDRDADQRFLRL